MAAAMAEPDFESWISAKLQSLNVDDEVFGNYIISILGEEDTNREEKIEAISGILEEVENEPVDVICSSILEQWEQCQPTVATQDDTAEASASSEAKMTSIMEKHATAVVKKEELSKEKQAEKAALLAKYGHVSEEEDDEDYDEESASGKATGPVLEKNMNAEFVQKMQKEQRDKSKQEHEKKKEQDKEQRAKDKQKALDRKEKEKKRTQKQERRR